MRTGPYRWLWGLPLVLAIWLISFWDARETIEQDLKQRVEHALNQAGLDWASVGANGLDVALLGEAYSEDERELARQVVAGTRGVWNILDHSSLAAIETDYIWTAAVEDDAIKLSGFYEFRYVFFQIFRRLFKKIFYFIF